MKDEFKSQLTALALDELPPGDRSAVEATLADTPEAQAYAAQTSDFCALLKQSLALPVETGLTDDQRADLTRKLTTVPAGPALAERSTSRRVWLAWTSGLGAAAAAIAVSVHLGRDSAAVEWAGLTPTASGGASNGMRGVVVAQVDQFVSYNKDLAGLTTSLESSAEGEGQESARPLLSEQSLSENLFGDEAETLDGLVALQREGDDSRQKSDHLSETRLSGSLALQQSAPAGPLNDEAKLADFDVKPQSLAETVTDAAPAAGASLAQVDQSASTTRNFFSLQSEAVPSSEPASTAGRDREVSDRYLRLAKKEKWDFVELQESRQLLRETEFGLGTAAPAGEGYEEVPENAFLAVASEPLSTFSIDVDTAGYANVRRFLNQGQLPPKAAVRLEEMVNYFRYDYPQPVADKPFSVTVDVADCPWEPKHRLARVGLQGKVVAREARPAANLVFLVDVSGSMDEPNKLPLVRQSLHLLTSQLKGSDHVAIVTYAGSSGVVLPSTSLEQKESVTRAIDALSAGGSTNGASGIQLAYQQARQNFKAGGVNRVLLATDGDFNVGLTTRDELQNLITEEAKSGVFLSVLGYGMGNLKDGTMEMLSDQGNGNYAYIDSLSEARKALGDQLEGTLMTIAKDVKIQVEFNPAHVRNYRLLGYENRMLAKEDFNDDKKDAGEIGAGHSVTALYEIVPTSAPPIQPPVDALKYQAPPVAATAAPAPVNQPVSRESMTVKLRFKAPDGEVSQLIEVPVVDEERKLAEAPADFKFATSVAMTGLLLKQSAYKGAATWAMVRELARAGKGPDAEGYRGEFLQLIEKAAGVAP